MKKIALSSGLLVLCLFTWRCNNSDCDKSIGAVQPNSNPAGYEVLLKTKGFTDAAQVVFGTVPANSRAGGADGEIIATVPAGLSGNVEISVEEGDCIARSAGFIVLGALPGNVQNSLPVIVVPAPPPALPTGNIENNWANTASLDNFRAFGIHLVGDLTTGTTQLDGSFEYDFSVANSFFDGNPVKGTITVNQATKSSTIYLEIDRRAKTGGTVEHFDGQFIDRPAVPNISLDLEQWFILLVSRETGRQLLISYPL